MILAGDIGGTKTAIALYDESLRDLTLVRSEQFASKQHASLEEILESFLSKGDSAVVQSACFGIAGPVIDGTCETTNLPWRIAESNLATVLKTRKVKLLNDLEAAAFGMLHLESQEFSTLQVGSSRRGNIAVIAAGTGLGEGMLVWDGTQYHPVGCEGGHARFAPQNDLEIELLVYLRSHYRGHVSFERVLSGPGVSNVYRFLRDSKREPASAEVEAVVGDPSATITRLGLAGNDPICTRTLAMFCSLYGAESANLALKTMALGGVFIGGGIAPKILPALHAGGFVDSFLDTGRFAQFMRDIPVKVALNPRAPLLGAAHYARRMALN